jgi:hypothetical protein
VRWALVSELLSELGCCSLPGAFSRLWTHSNTVYCDTCSYNIGSAVVSECMSYSVDGHRQLVGIWSCTGIRAVFVSTCPEQSTVKNNELAMRHALTSSAFEVLDILQPDVIATHARGIWLAIAYGPDPVSNSSGL